MTCWKSLKAARCTHISYLNSYSKNIFYLIIHQILSTWESFLLTFAPNVIDKYTFSLSRLTLSTQSWYRWELTLAVTCHISVYLYSLHIPYSPHFPLKCTCYIFPISHLKCTTSSAQFRKCVVIATYLHICDAIIFWTFWLVSDMSCWCYIFIFV